MRRQVEARGIRDFDQGDVCVLLERYDAHTSGPQRIWLLKGTIVTVVDYNYAGCYDVKFDHGGASIPGHYLRKLCPLELLALEADPSASEEELVDG